MTQGQFICFGMLFVLIQVAAAKNFVTSIETTTVSDNEEATFSDDHIMLTNKTTTNVYEDPTNITHLVHFIDYKTLPEYEVYSFFTTYFLFFTTVPGLLTNPLSIYVALKLRPQTTSELHMFVLGVTDFFVVLTRLTIHILRLGQYRWTDMSCKSFNYFVNIFYIYSNWVLVSWTLERLVAVMFPMKMNSLCTRGVLKKIIFTSFVVICLVTIPLITESHSVSIANSGNQICQFTPFYFKIYSTFETVIYMYAPILVVLVSNFTIIVMIKKASKRRAAYTTNQEILAKRAREQKQTTTVLLTISLAFFLLHLPQVIAKICQAIYPDLQKMLQEDVRFYMKFNLWVMICYQITDFQNSVNFILYCVFGSKVQTVLLHMFRCGKPENNKPISSITNSTIL